MIRQHVLKIVWRYAEICANTRAAARWTGAGPHYQRRGRPTYIMRILSILPTISVWRRLIRLWGSNWSGQPIHI